MTSTGMISWPTLAPFARVTPRRRGGPRCELFTYDSGPDSTDKKTPIVLVHGLGDEADSWRHVFASLSADRRVMAPDLPGFGRSRALGSKLGFARDRANLALHAKAILSVLEETGPAILVGSSLGAAVAELVAFQRPELTRALICIDGGLPSSGKASPGLLLSLMPFVGKRGYRAYRQNHEAAYRSLKPYYSSLDGLSEEDRDFLRKRVIDRVESDAQMHAYYSSLRSYVATAAFKASRFTRGLSTLAERNVPMLAVWGDADRIIPIDSLEALSAAAPSLERAVIAGAGHLPHQERSKETIDAIIKFLNRHGL
jgi:pimeloyl-ACP methyl ester carboxylesterase